MAKKTSCLPPSITSKSKCASALSVEQVKELAEKCGIKYTNKKDTCEKLSQASISGEEEKEVKEVKEEKEVKSKKKVVEKKEKKEKKKEKKEETGDCKLPADITSKSKCATSLPVDRVKELAKQCGISYTNKKETCEKLVEAGKLVKKVVKKVSKVKKISEEKEEKEDKEVGEGCSLPDNISSKSKCATVLSVDKVKNL